VVAQPLDFVGRDDVGRAAQDLLPNVEGRYIPFLIVLVSLRFEGQTESVRSNSALRAHKEVCTREIRDSCLLKTNKN
jgi:hypothetical protein